MKRWPLLWKLCSFVIHCGCELGLTCEKSNGDSTHKTFDVDTLESSFKCISDCRRIVKGCGTNGVAEEV